MRVYRISRAKYIRDISGTGSKIYGGRWNSKGFAMLYASENKSLAALEGLVHFNRNTIPDDLQTVTLKLPKTSVKEFDLEEFQRMLKSDESNLKFKETGVKWLESKISLGLRIPSILIPGEKNILINPDHKLFQLIEIGQIEEFKFDERFFI